MEVSIKGVFSGSEIVCVCDMEPDSFMMSIRIGSVEVAGATSLRYPGWSSIIPLFEIVPKSVVFLRVILSEGCKNEFDTNPHQEFESVAPELKRTGPSPGLTRKK